MAQWIIELAHPPGYATARAGAATSRPDGTGASLTVVAVTGLRRGEPVDTGGQNDEETTPTRTVPAVPLEAVQAAVAPRAAAAGKVSSQPTSISAAAPQRTVPQRRPAAAAEH